MLQPARITLELPHWIFTASFCDGRKTQWAQKAGLERTVTRQNGAGKGGRLVSARGPRTLRLAPVAANASTAKQLHPLASWNFDSLKQ